MDVFLVNEFILCDDPYYGYNAYLRGVCGSFNDAKAMLDAIISHNYGENEIFGRYGEDGSFARINRMKIGSTESEVLYTTRVELAQYVVFSDIDDYDTSKQNKNDELCSLVDTGNDEEYDDSHTSHRITDTIEDVISVVHEIGNLTKKIRNYISMTGRNEASDTINCVIDDLEHIDLLSRNINHDLERKSYWWRNM